MLFLQDVLIFLLAAVVVVSVLKRLGMSSVLGYLCAGLLIGHAGIESVAEPEAVLGIAEIGVVLLLFVIGLELQPRRLWVMRHLVFGLGSLQVALTAVLIAAVLLTLTELGTSASLLLGFALALSSTAFVLQLLGEQKKLYLPHGRAAFGTLLLQDLAVVPALALVSLAAGGAAGHAETPRLIPVLTVVAGAVALRYLLRPLLKFVAAAAVHELFTAAALALVAGTALAMEWAGLSMALGAFVAGMMVAGSQYRHELEADVDPFRGLFLGLFFMAVGMTVNVGLLAARPALVIGLTAALMASKAALLVPLARWHGLSWRESARAGVVLSQGGEFAFVLLTAATGAALVEERTAQLTVLVVTLSMAATPLLVALADRLLTPPVDDRPFDHIDPTSSRVVVAGFGRVGQIVARVLAMRHIPFTALEINPHHVDFVRQFGNTVYYGDAARLDVLRAAGVPGAKALVLAVGNEEASLKIVAQVRATCPGVKILARATTRRHELQLRELGVDFVLRDTLHSSLRLARELLEQLGLSADEARHAVTRFEEHDAHTLERQAAVFRDEEAFRRTTLTATEELERLFEEDVGAEGPGSTGGARRPERQSKGE